jgi:hypothetical protein
METYDDDVLHPEGFGQCLDADRDNDSTSAQPCPTESVTF